MLSADEVGAAVQSLNTMKNSLHSVIHQISETSQHVAAASEELSATSQQISATAEEISAQANVVSQASQQVNHNLQSVSTVAEEMTSTIQSISSNTHEEYPRSRNRREPCRADGAGGQRYHRQARRIERRNWRSHQSHCSDCPADQTSRPECDHRGCTRQGSRQRFCGCREHEVKELARQTAQATEDISHKINTIQTDTHGALEAIGTITSVINQVNEISGTIATAVEEQSATTNEMTRNVGDAAKGSRDYQ